LNARDPGRRDTPGKVLKDRRSPRERGRVGTSVRKSRLKLEPLQLLQPQHRVFGVQERLRDRVLRRPEFRERARDVLGGGPARVRERVRRARRPRGIVLSVPRRSRRRARGAAFGHADGEELGVGGRRGGSERRAGGRRRRRRRRHRRRGGARRDVVSARRPGRSSRSFEYSCTRRKLLVLVRVTKSAYHKLSAIVGRLFIPTAIDAPIAGAGAVRAASVTPAIRAFATSRSKSNDQ